MTVEAGLTLAEAQAAADSVDRLFPLSLPSEGSCQIGGNLGTNAGGVGVLAYGNARQLVLGLEVVLADGRIWHGLSAPEEGQHRLRPQGPVHRLGGHARHHHRRRPEAVPQAGREGHGLRRAARPRQPRSRSSAWPRRRPARASPPSSSCRASCSSSCCSNVPGTRDPFPTRASLVRAAGDLGPQGRRHRRAAADRNAGSGHRARSHRRRRHRRLAHAGARFLAPARSRSPRRRSPRAATSRTTSRCRSPRSPSSSPAPTPPSRGSAPARGPWPLGHFGDGNVHYNIAQPVGMPKTRVPGALWTDIDARRARRSSSTSAARSPPSTASAS